MDFLSKKSWHPGRAANMRKVAERELEVETKKRRAAEGRRRVAEAREQEERDRLMRGGAPAEGELAVAWMYDGVAAAAATPRPSAEEYLLGRSVAADAGRPPVAAEPSTPSSSSARSATAAALLAEARPRSSAPSAPSSAADQWSKNYDDPLSAIQSGARAVADRRAASAPVAPSLASAPRNRSRNESDPTLPPRDSSSSSPGADTQRALRAWRDQHRLRPASSSKTHHQSASGLHRSPHYHHQQR